MKRGYDKNTVGVTNTKKIEEEFRVAVKRRRGVPKSVNKNLCYSKKFNGCEDTSFAKAINKFETKHKRSVCVDDIVNIFRELQCDEPHAEVIVCQHYTSTYSNYYSALESLVYTYDEEPITVQNKIYYQHIKRSRKVVKKHNYTFDEVINEHKTLLSMQEHNKVLNKYEIPHSIDFKLGSEPNADSNAKNNFKNCLPDIQVILDSIKKLSPDSDKYIDIIEDLLFISYVIIYCEDPNILFGTLVTIYKKHSGGSLTSSVYKFIHKICFVGNREAPQSMEFKTYLNKIMGLKNSILFNKIRDGLSLCIALGFVNPIHITVHNVELFACKALDLKNSSIDFISYVLDLLTYFFEIGYQIFSGNYERIFDMSELSKIDDDLLHLKTYINSIKLGSYEIDTNYTIEDYHAKLSYTIESLKILSAGIKDRVHKSLIQSKLSLAYQLLVEFDQSKPLAGLRECPFSLSFFGSSSVGKSSSAKMVLTNLLNFNNKSSGDEYICTIQPTDKFYSTYKANVTGVIIDDICNTRHDKAVVDPAQLLISLINNVPYYAPKAESYEKGKINVRPAIVVTTTNVANMEAHIWSNEPISVVRRMKYHITVRVKPQYSTNSGLDSSKVLDTDIQCLQENGLQDLWYFDVNFVKRYHDNTCEKWKFELVEFEGKTLTNIDIWELTRFLNIKSREHFAEQELFVRNCKNSGLRHKNCEVCCYPKCKCTCQEPDDSIQGGVYSLVDNFCEHIGTKAANYIIYNWNKVVPNLLEQTICEPMFRLAILSYMKINVLNLINYIPYSVRETDLYRTIHYYSNRYKLYRYLFVSVLAISLGTAYYTDFSNVTSLFKWGIFNLFGACIIYRHFYSNIMNELKTAPLHTIVPIIQSHDGMQTIIKAGIAIPVAIMVLKTFKAFYRTLRNTFKEEVVNDDTYVSCVDDKLEGNLNPTSYEDISTRDKEVNCWAKRTETFVNNPNTTTMTSEQLLNAISPNILNLTMMLDENTGTSIGCIALKSNVFCCPLHFFKDNKNVFGNWRPSNITPASKDTSTLYKIRFIKHDGSSGNYFSATIDNRDIVRISDLDLCIFKVFSGGSFKDITQYFSYNKGETHTLTLKRARDGTLHRGSAYIRACDTSYAVPSNYLFSRVFKIQGGKAKYNLPTNCGDCMMVHVTDSRQPSIVGFHVSGLSNTNQGSYTMFTTEQLDDAIRILDNKFQIFTPHSGNFMNVNRLGTIIKVSEDIPDKAPVSYIKDHNYIIRGTVDSQVSYFTDIKPTFMCSKVERIFGITNIWAGPKFGPQRWKPWYTFLSSSSENDSHMDSSLLKLAKSDYLSPLKEALLSYNAVENMRPLEHMEVINGIPGKRFIDHINFNSSIGYPLGGKKSKYMKGYPTQYDFDNEMFDIEYNKMRECYLKHERYYPIFKASLKDEPMKITKDKVRVFQAADITLQYGWRKYGLPILRFLSTHPLLSECAVGINPYNDEWNQVYNHLTFDDTIPDRIVAGDYKSWDQKLPAQLVLTAFDVIIQIAKCIPTYTDEDICMITGLATDTTYYLSHFNGTLIEFNNGLPSGHNLTAHINSIANSILLRYGYYTYNNPAPFRKYCKAITYGDDFECGVSNKIHNFDHLKYKKVVDNLKMNLTMPDKESTPIPFLHINDCDFLKRRSVKCDINGIYYGALDFNSMMRSLMVRGKTSVSEREHAQSVIRGFIHDLSYHTRDFYEQNIKLIRELLNEINIIIPQAHFDYDTYYQYRNNELDWWDNNEQVTLDSAIRPVGYPMTPEASGSDDSQECYVSSTTNTTEYECGSDDSTALAENLDYNSYLSTKVLSENEPRRVHDDCIQSQVFGSVEGESNTNTTETGTSVLTSGVHHTTQSLPLVSKPLLSLRQHESRELGRYLERPRRISSYNPANANSVTLDPLTLFLATEVIRDKIRWYAYLNAVLHVKVVVVGSPLMAGSQLVALHPWYRRDNSLGSLSFGNTRPTITQLSQLPSFITDLSREKGGEISMPIICPSNGLAITDLEQIKSAFALHIVNLTNTVLPATTSSVVPELAVYVWLTDVSLTGTTFSTELPQSDEYHVKKEDIPSSDHISLKEGLSKAAGHIVGKATELGVNKVMGAMGFSNPNSMDGVAPNVPKIASNMACYNAPVNIESLAGDYKNEVPLDGKLLGFDDSDHMALSNIYTRYSILGVASFTTGNAPTGPIETYVFPVTPMASQKLNRGSYDIYVPTALGVAALPFNRWRGTMTYKFQAIGTAFMKGKIKISHDVNTFTTISEGQKHNTQQLNSIIWDLSTTKEIEVTVPWCSNQPFKTTGNLKEGILLESNNTVSPVIDVNGLLFMCPFTAISESIPSIEIIVSVKGEEGFSFGDMRAVLANYTFAGINNTLTSQPEIPQSEIFSNVSIHDIDYTLSDEYFLRLKDGRVYAINPEIWAFYIANKYLLENSLNETPQSMIYIEKNNDSILTGNEPNDTFKVNIAGIEDNIDDNDLMTMVCMGEKWYSIRQIIKRYTHNWTRSIQNPNQRDSYYRIRLPDRPLVKGWQGTYSLNVQPDGTPVTFARDSFLSFYSVCFLGYRGSLRHKVAVKSSHSSTSYADQPMVMVARSTSGYLEERVDIHALSAGTAVTSISASASSIPRMADARAGATLGYSHVNPVVEYSTPYYSRGKFCWAQDRFPQLLKSTADGGYDVPWHQIIVTGFGNTSNVRTRIDKYVAAGDDFSLFFYLYGPQMVLEQPVGWAQS